MRAIALFAGLAVAALAGSSVGWAQTATKAQVLAFPGAEGYGALATGGRGKPVMAVTTLADDGPGSFRAATAKGDAMVVFRIAGVIHLKSTLTLGSNLTIEGQSAPGSGVTVADAKVTMNGATNIIIRYVRFRGGIAESSGSSSLQFGNGKQAIGDHLSIEWGRWDNIQAEESEYTTLQNSIVGEGIVPQRFGCLCESNYGTFARNLWIDNKSRNPKGKGHIQYVNNVVYDWGGNGYVGGHSAADHDADLVGNYFIKGPESSDAFIGEFAKTDHTYQTGNLLDDNKNGKLDGRSVTDAEFDKAKADVVKAPTQKPEVPVRVEPADRIVEEIAASAGDTLCRDAVDARLVDQLRSLGTKGKLIADENEVGGEPAVVEGKAAVDSDGDGIPDAWEKAHHLNPKDAADGQAIDPKTGYSNLELYLNELASGPVRACGGK